MCFLFRGFVHLLLNKIPLKFLYFILKLWIRKIKLIKGEIIDNSNN